MYEKLYHTLTTEQQRRAYLDTVEYITRKDLLQDPERPGKLNGVSVLFLSVNCGRLDYIRRLQASGILPDSVRHVSCYGGTCWQEYTVANRFEKKRQGVETIADYSMKVVDASTIAARVKPRQKAFRDTIYYREGQAGDSSHAFIKQACGKSAAVAWLEALEAAGIQKTTVFITAGYAPVTMEEWVALVPYVHRLKLHFSLSGWLTREEIDCRLAMFEAARAAGLDPVVRVVTNRDNVNGTLMENESYLFQVLEALGVDRSHILETPYHLDATHTRSRAALPAGPICCETGRCQSCNYHCMVEGLEK